MKAEYYDAIKIGMERMKELNDFKKLVGGSRRLEISADGGNTYCTKKIWCGGQIRSHSQGSCPVAEKMRERWEEGDAIVIQAVRKAVDDACDAIADQLRSLGVEL